jgi:hypothetical protein
VRRGMHQLGATVPKQSNIPSVSSVQFPSECDWQQLLSRKPNWRLQRTPIPVFNQSSCYCRSAHQMSIVRAFHEHTYRSGLINSRPGSGDSERLDGAFRMIGELLPRSAPWRSSMPKRMDSLFQHLWGHSWKANSEPHLFHRWHTAV